MPFNNFIICQPLLLLTSIFPSIRVFSNESVLHIRWPKDWSFSFSISPSNEYSGLISFRIFWFEPLAVQGTLKSLLQHHSSKASILLSSDFFTAQLSHWYMINGKVITFTRQAFICKVIPLLFTRLSRFVIASLPKSKKCLLISWLQSPSTVTVETKKIKYVTVSIISPSICYEVIGPDALIFVFGCWVLNHLFYSPLSSSSRGSLDHLLKDDREIGRGDHFLAHKFIKRSFEHWESSTKQLMYTGRGHQAPRKTAHCLWKEIGQNLKDKKRDRIVRDRDPSCGGRHEGEASKHQETLLPVGLWGVLEFQRST